MTAKINPHRLDLNLIRVFVAIYETGSVTLAAEHLFLTQPTVSYGLSKLRELFADSLFVRHARGMAPTPRAEDIYRLFSKALADIDGTLEAAAAFDPKTATRHFRVAMSDIGGLYFLPPLLAQFQRMAPQAVLEVLQVPQDDITQGLASGKIDAAVGNLALHHDQLRSTCLFREHYVCLMAKNHPAIGKTLTLDKFVAARHVLVASPFSAHALIEDALRERGVIRKVGIHIPHFTILPTLIAQSDLLVTLPSRVAKMFEAYGNLVSMKLPVQLPDFEVRVHWHALHATAAAGQWFRDQIVDSLGRL